MIAHKALLLTILVAGAATITGDAYAQSNTERLQDIDEATEDILEGITGMPELFAAIQESVDQLMDSISGISSEVTGLSSNMSNLNSEVSSLNSDVSIISAIMSKINSEVSGLSSNMSSISSEVSDISSDMELLSASTAASSLRVESAISNFEPTLLGIATGVDSNRNTLENLSNIMASMNANIESIEASLGAEDDDGGLAQNIEFLTSTINRNELSVSDRLDKIEATLAELSEKLDTPTQASGSLTDFASLSKSMDVSSYTYKNQGDKRTVFGNDIYDLEFTFSCDGPVSIDEVSTDLTNRVSWIITDTTPDSRTAENYLKVDNRNLYNAAFAFSSNSYSVYNIPVEFNFEPLAVGETLRFESQQYDTDQNRIANADRTASDGYTITVEYLGARATTCSFSGSSGSSSATSGTLSNSGTLTLTPTVDTSSNILHPFSVDVTCDDDPVEITDIQATAVDGWNSGLAGFAKFELEMTDSNTTVEIDFENDGELGDYEYPISFSEDITISGELPGAENILILISYNTVSGGSCSEST